ncbi:hypothetical protein [Streptomyces apocyni]|uniref:hypothetical protein n=1 Tax=Streptomyces apocyni TaxID=2654677 RepID=UPI0012E9E1A4|nr:hypothetical protein [Streptomyces apocyni]
MAEATPDMLTIALTGFHAARERYRQDLTVGHDEEQLIIHAMEVVYWSCTLDEQLAKRDAWYEMCSEYGRRIMHGTRHARNAATHQLPMFLQKTEGAQWPVTFPFRFEEVRWIRADELPEFDRESRRQRENYVQYLQGQPVRHTVDEIANWFAAEQNRTGSPLNTKPWGDSGETVD